MTKYVVMSCNQTRAYSFMAPIAAMCWSHRTVFTPVVLLTQTREHWKDDAPSRLVVEMLDRLGVRKHYVGVVSDAYLTSTQAQTARHYTALLKSFEPDDYLLTTDIDGLPISGEWHDNVDWSKSCHMRNAGAWQYRWYTTFGFGAKVSAWREFMGYQPGGEIAPVMQKDFDIELTPEADTLLAWYYDEFLFNSRLKASRFYPNDCQFIERRVSDDRVDRGNWPHSFSRMDRYIDAHVLRPPFSNENWPRMKPLLEKLLTETQVELIDSYRNRFVEVA